MSFERTKQFLLSALLPTAASHARLRELLQAAPSGEPLDWETLAPRIENHALAPLLRFNLVQSGCLAAVPGAVQQQLATSCQTWAARHLAYVHEAQRLLVALAAANIRALPLKGAALMLGGYYPQPGLRPAVDLDLLVAPAQIHEAEQVAAACGYVVAPGRTQARPRQRLANELNHVAPRRGPGGILLELHTRAFQFVATGREFGFAEMAARAEWQASERGVLGQPAAADLALHLVHHALVDLQSAQAMLRTLADLHFIWQRTPSSEVTLQRLAQEFGFAGTVEAARGAVTLLAHASLAELPAALAQADARALLLETALWEAPWDLAAAARLVEYFDWSRQPLHKAGNLLALLFTNRAHLAQLRGQTPQDVRLWHYGRRPLELLRKFNWASLQPRHLRRVWQMRRLARRLVKD